MNEVDVKDKFYIKNFQVHNIYGNPSQTKAANQYKSQLEDDIGRLKELRDYLKTGKLPRREMNTIYWAYGHDFLFGDRAINVQRIDRYINFLERVNTLLNLI